MRAVQREEERFRQTLERGLDLLDGLVADGDVNGRDAFFLHDTLGFPDRPRPREIAEERGRGVDLDGFRTLMGEQRTRAQEAHKAAGGQAIRAAGAVPGAARRDRPGRVHRTAPEYETDGAKVRALVAGGERVAQAEPGSTVDVVLDRTPFYAESGGQVGDTGELVGRGCPGRGPRHAVRSSGARAASVRGA